MNNLSTRELSPFCRLLAEESGKIIKQYFRQNPDIETKEDETPVTIADKKAEEVMRELIMKEFPDHGILGEEWGNHNEGAEYTWILDPIDGTKSFVAGVPLFGTLICLLQKGKPLIGVINNPVMGDFLEGDNHSASLNGSPVKVRECADLSQALLLTTDTLVVGQYQNGPRFEELTRKVKLYRTWGDCYGYFLTATGFADIMIDPVLSRWDTMALIPVIRGAGGIITNYQGLDPVENWNSIVAAAPGIHQQVIELLN